MYADLQAAQMGASVADLLRDFFARFKTCEELAIS
jgi:hypothetical protein